MSGPDRIRPRSDVKPAIRVDADPVDALEEELAHHLAETQRRYEAAGLTPEEAAAEARRDFGDVSRTRRELLQRERRGRWGQDVRGHLDALFQDLGFAIRSARRRPAFTVVALLSLALGIGGVSAAATLVQQLLLRPLPLERPELVVRAAAVTPTGSANFGPGYVQAWRESVPGVESLGAAVAFPAALTEAGPPVRLSGARTTDGFFGTIGLAPSVGRVFAPEEYVFGGPAVVVLSHRVWVRFFDQDPATVGSQIRVNGEAWTVVGIMAPELDALAPTEFDVTDGVSELIAADFFTPLQIAPNQWSNFGGGWLTTFARLTDSGESGGVETRLEQVVADLGVRDSEGERIDVRLLPLSESFTDAVRRPLWVLLAAAFVVLVLCCLNLANLLLAQGANRRREMAIRSSLGAGQERLVRQLVTESIVMGAIGGVAGWAVARTALSALPALVPTGAIPVSGLGASGVTWLMCALLAVLTGLGFGLLPALRSGRVELGTELRSSGSVDRGGALGLRGPLILAEVALAMVLLTGAGLMLRSSYQLGAEARGYDEDVLTAQVTLPWAAYPSVPEALRALEAMTEALEREPSIQSAAFSSRVPLAGNSFGADVAVAGSDFSSGPDVQTSLRIASPGFIETLAMTMSSGRAFEPEDDRPEGRTVLANSALVSSLRLTRPVGTRLVLNIGDFRAPDGSPFEYEIVGVVDDVRDGGVRSDPRPELYFTGRGVPSGPWDWIGRELVLAVRSTGESPPTAPQVREAVAAVAPEIPLYNLKTLGERDAETVALERLTTVLLGTIGALAVLMAVAGIFGVVSYVVAGRTREIGLRIALGSSKRGALGMIVRQTMTPVLGGVVIGLLGSFATGAALRGLLYRTSAADPIALFAATVLVAGSALVASWIPARAATRVDPTRALSAD
ncbi:MAG: ADOP family duplicated permease [Gemmatimonadota bacterium]